MCVQGHAVGGCLQGCVPADAGGVVNLSGLQGKARGHRNMQGVCRGMQEQGHAGGGCLQGCVPANAGGGVCFLRAEKVCGGRKSRHLRCTPLRY